MKFTRLSALEAFWVAGLSMSLFCPSGHADEFFGHWGASQLERISKAHYRLNQFEFRVTDKGLDQFLRCVKKKHSSAHVFLSGSSSDPKIPGNIVKSAYWCDGEISLSSCAAENQRKNCP